MLGLADDTGKIAVAHDRDETGYRASAILLNSSARAFSGRSTRPCSIPANA